MKPLTATLYERLKVTQPHVAAILAHYVAHATPKLRKAA